MGQTASEKPWTLLKKYLNIKLHNPSHSVTF